MKKILFLLTILVSVPAFSQSADERIGAFLNQADWFGLEKNYTDTKRLHAGGFPKANVRGTDRLLLQSSG